MASSTVNNNTSTFMLLMRIFCLTACLVFSNHLYAQRYQLLKVYDGDTVQLTGTNGKFKFRLSEIDAPERNQAYGKKSRRALLKLCKGRDVNVSAIITGTDQYERYLGKLYCNGTDAGLYLVERGLAWHYLKYSNDLTIFSAQMNAKQAQIGLWKQNNPTPPWVWRKQQQFNKKHQSP